LRVLNALRRLFIKNFRDKEALSAFIQWILDLTTYKIYCRIFALPHLFKSKEKNTIPLKKGFSFSIEFTVLLF